MLGSPQAPRLDCWPYGQEGAGLVAGVLGGTNNGAHRCCQDGQSGSMGQETTGCWCHSNHATGQLRRGEAAGILPGEGEGVASWTSESLVPRQPLLEDLVFLLGMGVVSLLAPQLSVSMHGCSLHVICKSGQRVHLLKSHHHHPCTLSNPTAVDGIALTPLCTEASFAPCAACYPVFPPPSSTSPATTLGPGSQNPPCPPNVDGQLVPDPGSMSPLQRTGVRGCGQHSTGSVQNPQLQPLCWPLGSPLLAPGRKAVRGTGNPTKTWPGAGHRPS